MCDLPFRLTGPAAGSAGASRFPAQISPVPAAAVLRKPRRETATSFRVVTLDSIKILSNFNFNSHESRGFFVAITMIPATIAMMNSNQTPPTIISISPTLNMQLTPGLNVSVDEDVAQPRLAGPSGYYRSIPVR